MRGRGRVRIAQDDDTQDSSGGGDAQIVRKPLLAKSAALRGRGIVSGSSLAPAAAAESYPSVADVRDWQIEQPSVSVPPACSSDCNGSEDDDGPVDEAIAARVSEARRIRQERASEDLLASYISLEDTMQKYLDGEDIEALCRQDRKREKGKQRKRDSEDDTGDAADASDATVDSASEVDGEPDEEAAGEFADSDARVSMRVAVESVSERFSAAHLDFNPEEDEETRAWELLQIRKGTSAGRPAPRDVRRATRALALQHTATPHASKEPVAITRISTVLSEVAERSSLLVASIESARLSLGQVEAHMAETERGHEQGHEELKDAHQCVQFYMGIGSYVQSFGEMLDALLPATEAVERDWIEAVGLCRRQMTERVLNMAGSADPVDPASDLDVAAGPDFAGITDAKAAVLRSAASSFSDPASVFSKFAEWETRYPESYEQSFASLCLPGVFEIFVRLSMVGWDPLGPAGGGIAEYTAEVFDGFAPSFPREAREALLARVVLPKLVSYTAAAYCAHSPRHSRSAADLVREVPRLLAKPERFEKTLRGILNGALTEAPASSPASAALLSQSAHILQDATDPPLDAIQQKITAHLGPAA